MENMNYDAIAQVDLLNDIADNYKHGLEIRAIMIALVGIIYALLYIGYCIKEIKNE